IGFNEEKAQELRRRDYEGLLEYWQVFDAHAVVRALSEHQNSVFDFGAIHSVFDNAALFLQVADALAPFANVILLLPCADKQKCVQVLHERGKANTHCDEATLEMWRRIIQRFVCNPSNERLAKQIVYTDGRTPEQTLSDVMLAVSES